MSEEKPKPPNYIMGYTCIDCIHSSRSMDGYMTGCNKYNIGQPKYAGIAGIEDQEKHLCDDIEIDEDDEDE